MSPSVSALQVSLPLPPELTKRILYFVSRPFEVQREIVYRTRSFDDDYDSRSRLTDLQNCRLVCKTFEEMVTPFLFEQLIISFHQFDISYTISQHPLFARRDYKALLDVQELQLLFEKLRQGEEEVILHAIRSAESDTLTQLSMHASKLKKLKISLRHGWTRTRGWTAEPPLSVCLGIVRFPALEVLELEGFDTTEGEMVHFLDHHRTIQELYFSCMDLIDGQWSAVGWVAASILPWELLGCDEPMWQREQVTEDIRDVRESTRMIEGVELDESEPNYFPLDGQYASRGRCAMGRAEFLASGDQTTSEDQTTNEDLTATPTLSCD